MWIEKSTITAWSRHTLACIQARCVQAWAGPGLPVFFVATYAVAYLASFPLLTWHDIPHKTFANLTSYHKMAALGMLLAGLTLLILCRRMGRVAGRLPTQVALSLIVIGWLGACVCAVFTFPGQSSDMGDYIFRAHMLVHLGRNPLTTPPSKLIVWKEFPYLSWYKEPDYYGPLWQWLSGATHALAGEDLLANFLAYKLLGMISVGVAGVLIYRILLRKAPGYAVTGLGLWLWNPVVINEGVMHGHNDLVMILLILSGVGLLLLSAEQKNDLSLPVSLRQAVLAVSGIVLLGAAGLVKATIWILLPVAAVWLIRQYGYRKGLVFVAVGLLACTALVWLAYRPFGGWGLVLTMVQKRGWWPTNSWSAALFFALRDGAGWAHAAAKRWVLGGALILFALIAGWAMLRVREIALAAWSVTLAYLLIGSIWFQPWYATIVIAFASLVPNKRVADFTLVLSFFMLLHPVVSQFVVSRITLLPGGYHLIMSVITLLVPSVLALIMAIRSDHAGRL